MKTTSKTLLSSGTYLQSIAIAGTAIALLSSTSAFAQAAPADDTTADEPTIVVTGSLIRNPNLEQSNPVNVTTADQIELKQSNVAEEVLRELPGVVPNIGSAVNNGNGGSSYVDLRGLGSNRNIVLLDGNRLVPADLQGRVDLNNIPLALISRVDALTGAAVTTYGADAITGVVNFITRKDFAGVDLTMGEQITERGDGNVFRGDLTVGANFDDGRGNAVLSIGYQESDPVYQGGRDFSVFNVDSFSGALGGSGTTTPSRFSLGAANRVINTSTGALEAGFVPFNFNPFNIFQTPFKRYNIFAQANYEVSDSVEVYTRALFSKNTVRTIIAPSGIFASQVTIPVSNPYLPLAAANQFCANNDFNATLAGIQTLTPAECAAARTATSRTDPNYREFTTVLRRRTPETGTRNSEFSSTVFDYRVGARGAINSHVDWDVNGSYGQSDKVQTITGYVLTSRVRDALLATNRTTCLSAAAGCVPLNVFGALGTITPDQSAYLLAPSTSTVKTSLGQVRGVLSGDLGITSPGATEAVGFALGTEYRSYHAQQLSDTLSKTPGELGGAGGAAPDINGGYNVWEGYGELVVPLIEDKPFFHSLTLEGGARYSHYKIDGGNTNDTWTYKAGGTWEPVPDFKIRGNYARAVRAPNIGELFSPVSTGLTTLTTDPCAGAAPTANANLRAVCIAQGAPAGSIGIIANPTASQANSTGGGNINLNPEKATTWTVGAVFQPAFVPGFSVSVDYYNIKVTDAITTPTSGDVINSCFGSISGASATSPACTSIRRNPTTGGLDGDPATTAGLPQSLSNLGRLSTDGIDVIANYSRDLGFAKWQSGFVFNYTHSQKFQATPTAVNRECVGLYSADCGFTGSIQPKYQWSWRNTLSISKIDVSFLWRHISGVKFEEGTGLFVGTIPAAAGVIGGRSVNFNRIAAYDWFDLSLRFNVNDNFTMTATVQNLLDKQPPLVGASVGTTAFNSGNTYPSTYDTLGRRFAVSAKLRF